MPQRRPRRAQPTSRLTTAARVGLVVVLAGVALARSGLLSRGRFDGAAWPLAQEARPVPGPGRAPTPSPAPPTPAGEPGDRLVSTVVVDGRTVSGWLRREADFGVEEPVVTISAPERPQLVLDGSRVHERTGTDVTGDGRADIIVERDTGGMGCCWSLQAYEVEALPDTDSTAPGSTDLGLRAVLDLPLTRCRGRFQDLDGDGADEVVTCDPTIPIALCSAAGADDPAVVLRYVAGKGYAPATPRFADALPKAESAPLDAARERGSAGEGLCAVLPAALDALYRGHASEAWAALDPVLPAGTTRATIERLAADSPLYVVGTP